MWWDPGPDIIAPALKQPSGSLGTGGVGFREVSTAPSAGSPSVVKTVLAGSPSATLENGSTETLTLFPGKGPLLPLGVQMALTTGTPPTPSVPNLPLVGHLFPDSALRPRERPPLVAKATAPLFPLQEFSSQAPSVPGPSSPHHS